MRSAKAQPGCDSHPWLLLTLGTGNRTRRALHAAIRLVTAGAGGALLMAAEPAAAGEAPSTGQTLRDVTFHQYTESSGNAELVRRLLSPLAKARLERQLSAAGKALAGRPVDLANERFLVYVPAPDPTAHRHALLVFVPPWQDARLPAGWGATLDRSGVIFVTAARSGNEESALGRREPLALLAAANVAAQYPVDPQRIYIAGFSGGSRIALRLALAYPELFRAALLNAGSDPIGNRDVPLPPQDLFFQFQQSSRLVYVTGERDTDHALDDMRSIRSMHQWCVAHLESYTEPRVAHEVADAAVLARALAYLEGSRREPGNLADCRAGLARELAAQLRSVSELAAGGRRAEAEKLLEKIDERFGGLAAPQSIDLAASLR
jgi:dienelactone hydrolase